MARTQRDSKLDTRTARLKLAPNKEPYWRLMEQGRAIGYRRLDGGRPGTWTARFSSKTDSKTRYQHQALGSADDYATADGSEVLTFAQAQTKAREWFTDTMEGTGRLRAPITVKEACDTYLDTYKAGTRSPDAVKSTERTIIAHILPTLGSRKVADLTTTELLSWRNALVQAKPRRRTPKPGKATTRDNAIRSAARATTRTLVPDKEAHRKRQATANRVLTVLKAALNLAFNSGMVSSDTVWRGKKLPAFKGADQPRVRYLNDGEVRKLVDACDPDFRAIVIAAILTGADWGELRSARVAGLDADSRRLKVSAKRGEHSLVLSDEAVRHLVSLSVDKDKDAFLFVRADGEEWGKSHQARRLELACGKAGITPAINFHILRHTFATRALRNGAPMQYVSTQLGHKNIRTTQRHYAHVIDDDVSNAIRKAMGDMGLVA